jgi:hypothetical protein
MIKDRFNVISFFMPVILCLTVVAAVGLGVVSAYAAVITILQAFGRTSQPAMARAPRLMLIPNQNQASGD